MPSRDGLLTHLRETERHAVRLGILADLAGSSFIGSLPFSAVGRLHGEFHRLDREDSARVSVAPGSGIMDLGRDGPDGKEGAS